MAEHRIRNIGEGYQIRPFYLCVDVSGSMGPIPKKSPPWPIDLVNKDLATLLTTLHKELEVSELIRLAIISFAETAELELPLSNLDEVSAMPTLQLDGETSYLQPLRKLRELIEEDFRNRKPNKWFRPVVLFVTDGFPNREPDKDWQDARDTLLDPKWDARPILVVFGFGEANEKVIKTLATGQKYTGLACIAARGQTPTSEIGHIMAVIQESIVESARNPSQFAIKKPEDFIVLSRPSDDDLG